MAKVSQRLWRIPGQRAKRKAWGYTAQVIENGQRTQKRCYKAEWTREDAEKALAELLLQLQQHLEAPASRLTFGDAVERYLKAKTRKKSIGFDRLYLNQLKAALGAGTPLVEITAPRISSWKADKLSAVCPRTGDPYAAATINRPLAALRHLLQLAHDEWGELPVVPRIRLE